MSGESGLLSVKVSRELKILTDVVGITGCGARCLTTSPILESRIEVINPLLSEGDVVSLLTSWRSPGI